MSELNYVKLLFAAASLLFFVLSIFLNYLEKYLPLRIKQAFSYGKFASQVTSGSIPQMEVPKMWFRHFYVYSAVISSISAYLLISTLIFDAPSHPLMLDVLNIVGGSKRQTNVSGISALIAMCLFTFHCYRRLYETHFVSVFATKGRMGLSFYLTALAYYTGVVLAILIETPKFTKTYQGRALYWTDLTFMDVVATLLFLWASWHQHNAAVILGNLRKDKKGRTVTRSHKLPHGDWFDYVSSPHFLAEILIYFALQIVLRNNGTWMYVFIWVVINQTEFALINHRWYQANFEELPKHRKAIIPFIY